MIKKLKKLIFEKCYIPFRAQLLKIRYALVLKRLRKEYGNRQIRVGFLVSEIAKWKGQSLFDLMAKSEDFDPEMLIIPSLHSYKKDTAYIATDIINKVEYFYKNGMKVTNVWDEKNKNYRKSYIFKFDIIFYQQTWDIPPAPYLEDVSKHSLTFYFPYYLVNNFIPRTELLMYLHYCVFRHIVFNDDQINFYKPYLKKINYAGKMVGLGHPSIDEFYLKKDYNTTKNYVIYAPHFSFKCDRHTGNDLPYYSSTFLEQGRFILEYAKKHTEINWVFKPHPRLRTELTDYDVWTKEEVDEYYLEWEKIGTVCFDSHYINYFLESKAMITDCSSFLTEYSCTGKPLIRLIPYEGKYLAHPHPALEKLYDCFYKSYNDKELADLLEMVVVDNKDPMKKTRIEQVEKAKLIGNYAAQNITDYIRKLLKNN